MADGFSQDLYRTTVVTAPHEAELVADTGALKE
jgi:hypothetical protein